MKQTLTVTPETAYLFQIPVTLEVQSGDFDVSSGPDSDTTIKLAAGDTQQFQPPTYVQSTDGGEIDVDYPDPQ